MWQRISTPEGFARRWAPGNISPVLGHTFPTDMGKGWRTLILPKLAEGLL